MEAVKQSLPSLNTAAEDTLNLNILIKERLRIVL